ncbi:DUF6440 family protein [Butyrivibrio sp.]|uniref:DUF6440 family protein n=1 Tax=Butyrivibrio sp. TaxID=28121 RepID=UPI0025C6ACEC|nr:DUF6440 family protein [Butyrivibrio sp.]MBE5838428.1 hypothetical protein [Butyrivibrio sp.]
MGRFEPVSLERIRFEGDFRGDTEVRIMRDSATGVMYIFTSSGNAGGLAPLLGTDGRPEFFISK